MALIVETGQGVAGANAFVSVEEADAYHSDRANAAWTGTDAVKSAAIIKATQYVNDKYSGRWKGYRTFGLFQPLHWPRQWVLQIEDYPGQLEYLDQHTLPQCLKDAVCEAALRSLSSDLAADLERGGLVASKKVGPLTTEFAANAPATTTYQVIDQLLSTLLKPKTTDAVRG